MRAHLAVGPLLVRPLVLAAVAAAGRVSSLVMSDSCNGYTFMLVYVLLKWLAAVARGGGVSHQAPGDGVSFRLPRASTPHSRHLGLPSSAPPRSHTEQLLYL